MRLDRLGEWSVHEGDRWVIAGGEYGWPAGGVFGVDPDGRLVIGRYTDVSVADPTGLVTLAFGKAPTDVSPRM
jgi:hypothetical protein